MDSRSPKKSGMGWDWIVRGDFEEGSQTGHQSINQTAERSVTRMRDNDPKERKKENELDPNTRLEKRPFAAEAKEQGYFAKQTLHRFLCSKLGSQFSSILMPVMIRSVSLSILMILW
jgi:hypothetical protein